MKWYAAQIEDGFGELVRKCPGEDLEKVIASYEKLGWARGQDIVPEKASEQNVKIAVLTKGAGKTRHIAAYRVGF